MAEGRSGEEFVQDSQRIYIHGGFGVELYVAKDFLGDFIAYLAIQRDQHRFGEGESHKLLDYRIVVSDKWQEILGLWAEAEGDSQFKKETDMEIAEIGADGIQKEDILLAPFEKSLLGSPFLDHTIQDLAHKHRDGVLEDIVTNPRKRMLGSNIPCGIETRLARVNDIGLQHVQRQEKRHHRLLPHSPY